MRRAIVLFALSVLPMGGVALAQRGWIVDPWQPGRPPLVDSLAPQAPLEAEVRVNRAGRTAPRAPAEPGRPPPTIANRFSYKEIVDPWPESVVARASAAEMSSSPALPHRAPPMGESSGPPKAAAAIMTSAAWARPPVEIVDPWPGNVSWAVESRWIVDPWN